jgi:Flp pilus assembly protein TadD
MAEAREALRLNPNDDSAHANLGDALEKKGDVDGAVVEYREALRLNPNNSWRHLALGSGLEKKGDVDGAIAEYREALRLNSKNEDAHVFLGLALEKEGDVDGAVVEYREALRLNSKDENAHVLLGLALEKKGEVDGAVVEYREALRLNPNDDLAHSCLDRALKSTGKPRVLVELWWAGGVFKPEKQSNPAKEMTAFAQSCPQSTVTVDDQSADYTLRLSYGLDPRFNDGLSQIVNNQLHLIYGYTLFDHRGNLVGTQPVSSSLTEAAQGACKATLSNWSAR